MQNLNQLVNEYGVNKQNLDELKKIVDEQNTNIKATLTEMNLDKYATDDYKVTKSISNRVTMNEDKALKVAYKYQEVLGGIIKTKEYVDTDELENLLYNGELSDEIKKELQSCIQSKEVVTLRVSKVKEV